MIRPFTLQTGAPDRFRWKWTADNQFTTASAYHAFFIRQEAILGAKFCVRPERRGNANFSVGWLYTTAAGPERGGRDITCKMMIAARYVIRNPSPFRIYLAVAPAHVRYGTDCSSHSVGTFSPQSPDMVVNG